VLDEGLLDDIGRLAETDRSAMLREVAAAGAQLRQSAFAASEAGVDRLRGGDRPRVAVVLACGPAALAGDLLRVLAGPASRVPVTVLRDADELPLWVAVTDTVLAVSYSGVEQGLLAATGEAARRGAQVVGVAPADTPMEDVCARYRAAFLPVPTGWRWRAALWSLAGPLLLAAGAAGVVPVGPADLDVTADLLDVTAERCRLTTESFVNPAKTLALELAETLPVVWGTSPPAGVAARRFAAQLAGCAATAACWGELPGAALEFGGLLDAPADPADFFRDRVEEPGQRRLRLVLLRDLRESPAAERGIEQALRAAGEHGVPVSELRAAGDGPLQRFASLAALADFASVYLGLAAGVDQAQPRTGQDQQGR
jgi:glucose/mannose-6-phosphate isomerase